MKLFLDFETRSTVDLRKCGADVYARHPSTEVVAMGYAFDDGPVKVLTFEDERDPPEDLVRHFIDGGKIVAHNAHFEWLIFNFVLKATFVSIKQFECTMAMAYAMGLPGSLEKAASAAGIKTQKDMKGSRIMLQLSQPTKNGGWYDPIEHKDKYDRMYAYCAQDVEVERELYKRLLPLSRSEQEMWEIDHTINQRGVRVDVHSAISAIDIVDYEQNRLDEDMRRITNGEVASCTANAQLTKWLNKNGCETKGVGKADISNLLRKRNIPDITHRALEIRKEAAKSSTAKFEAFINRADKTDQRIRSTTQYHGAGTGRWSGRGVQLQNLPRPQLKQNEIEGIFKLLK